ncbi:MAG: hypothetical protein KGM16_18445 [Bacteroidota bacterium]|nr:hypothetical protein [Bacteroidota bacterium]
MKTKFTMLIAFILIATTGIYAQGMQRMTVPERVKMTMDKITPALNLDATQQNSTEKVFTDFYTAQMKMFQDARASGERPDRSQFQKLMDDRDAKLKGIFTADQYTKFKSEVEASLRPQRQQQNSN